MCYSTCACAAQVRIVPPPPPLVSPSSTSLTTRRNVYDVFKRASAPSRAQSLHQPPPVGCVATLNDIPPIGLLFWSLPSKNWLRSGHSRGAFSDISWSIGRHYFGLFVAQCWRLYVDNIRHRAAVGHPSIHLFRRSLASLSSAAGLPISLTITVPICSSAALSVRRASFVAVHKLYHRRVPLVCKPVVLLNYRRRPTDRKRERCYGDGRSDARRRQHDATPDEPRTAGLNAAVSSLFI